MALVPGTRLGPYEILAPLGAGGMGEVYRARDTKLNREVALKVLPAPFAADPDRLSRFNREAQTLAALNHPNIGAVYGLEDTHGFSSLVLELVEGPTLADRMARGPVPVDEAWRIAKQLAVALDVAHGLGIVHRDLKPANIKIRSDGTIKVLDFGLAKLVADPSADPDRSSEPALTTMPTEFGTILGTPAYMAPEQARGGAVDKRADNWAFGVILAEMLTGHSLFGRPTAAETIAAVLHHEPDWTHVPLRLRRLLRSCLQKDPRERLRDIGDAHLLVDEEAGVAKGSRHVSRLGWLAAGLATAIAVAAILVARRPAPSAAGSVHFHIAPTVGLPASGASAISPDGRYLAFIGIGEDGVQRVYVRDMNSLVDRALSGAELSQAAAPPFWSPDSRSIAFDSGGTLERIDVSGGLAEPVCRLSSPAIGGSWNREGLIIVGSLSEGILSVPAEGGSPTRLTEIDRAAGENAHLAPVFLPDGKRFIYLRKFRDAPERTGLFVGSTETAPTDQERRRILATPSSVAYAPAGDGSGTLLFLRDGNLMSQAFDERTLEVSGQAALVAERVDAYRDTATISVSTNGVLVYRSAASLQLTWLDRQGRVSDRFQETGQYMTVNLSPDGTRAIISKALSQVSSRGELWLFDFARDTTARLLTPDVVNDGVWSPDGRQILFDTIDELHRRPLDHVGPTEVVVSAAGGRKSPTSWSRDGRFVMYTVADAKTASDLWAASVDGATPPAPFLNSSAAENQGQFSPTGSPVWVAYTSNESGRNEVFVRAFPDGSNLHAVSRSGGHSARWRGDGRELFYLSGDGMVTAVPFGIAPDVVGNPTPLFKVPTGFATRDSTGFRGSAPWGVTPDGQRFLFAAPAQEQDQGRFTVVLNWRPPQQAQ